MSGNNKKEIEAQYRNNNIDIYQIQFRFCFERSINNRKNNEMDVKIRISISI